MPAHADRTNVLFLLLDLDLRLFEVLFLFPFWVCALLTVPSIRTETRQEIGAHLLAYVLFGATRTQWAEAAVVVRTGWQLALRVDVEVETFVAIATEAIPQKEVALGHLSQIELVEEFAGLALFAEAPQPMLTDEGVEWMSTAAATVLLRGVGDMSFRAAGA